MVLYLQTQKNQLIKIMKKATLSVVLILVFAALSSVNTFAQKKFRGVINYTISYGGTIDAATAAQQPKAMTFYVYDNLTKMNISLGPVNIDVITNGDNKSTTTLLDIMGEKKYYKMTKEEIDGKLAEGTKPTVNYLEETKTIAGYVCKKAEYVEDNDGEKTTTIVYYSEELGNTDMNFGGQFHYLKGLPMEYVVTTTDGIITTFAATEVKKGKVKDTDFLIPSDYAELTADEKKQMLEQFEGKE